jgi:epoxyqueuosine reductase
MGSRIFGCDECQEICPWNRFACPTAEKEFLPAEGNLTPVLSELMCLTEMEFNFRFKASPVKRARYDGFLRNVAVALGNSGNPQAVPVLEEALFHASPLVRGHAAWALGCYQRPDARNALRQSALKETDPYVMEEIRRALGGMLKSKESKLFTFS